MLALKKISEEQIIKLLQKNGSSVWGILYDRYSASMYGIICSLTDDIKIAEQILIEVFKQLKERQILSKVKHALCPNLLRYTYDSATMQLKKYGITQKTLNVSDEVKLIYLLHSQCSSLKEAASILNLSEEETKQKIRSELLQYRNQNQSIENLHQTPSYN